MLTPFIFLNAQDILLAGVVLFTGHNGSGYDVDVEMLQSGNSYFKKRVTVPYKGDSNPFQIPVNKPIGVDAGVIYTVTRLAHSSIGYYGKPCQPVCTNGNVTVMFSKHSENISSTSSTSEIYGQILRFYFVKFN